MRHIGELETPQQAEAFLSYLLVKEIQGHADSSGDRIEIWVKDEDHFEHARDELRRFKESPNDPKYADSIREAKAIVDQEIKRHQEIKKRIVNPGKSGDFGPSPRITIGLFIVCVIVALLTNFGDAEGRENGISRALQFTCVTFDNERDRNIFYGTLQANIDSIESRTLSLRHGEIWRLITPIFIHYGIMHIVFNMYMLFVLGSLIEKRYGMVTYSLLVLATAIIPNFAQCVVPMDWGGAIPGPARSGPHIMTMLGGMSGVVYGLFGFAWMKSTYDPKAGFRLTTMTINIMLIWLVACIFAKQLNDIGIGIVHQNVANWAHGVGLAVGMAIGYLTIPSLLRK